MRGSGPGIGTTRSALLKMLHFLYSRNSQGQGTHGHLKNVIRDYMGIVMGICSFRAQGLGLCNSKPHQP